MEVYPVSWENISTTLHNMKGNKKAIYWRFIAERYEIKKFFCDVAWDIV